MTKIVASSKFKRKAIESYKKICIEEVKCIKSIENKLKYSSLYDANVYSARIKKKLKKLLYMAIWVARWEGFCEIGKENSPYWIRLVKKDKSGNTELFNISMLAGEKRLTTTCFGDIVADNKIELFVSVKLSDKEIREYRYQICRGPAFINLPFVFKRK